MTKDIFDTPFNKALKSVRKYSPDQARDNSGKWTAGGVARAVGAGALTAAVLAGAGVPILRNVPGLRGIRQAVLAGGQRAARHRMNNLPAGETLFLGGGHGRHVSARAQAIRNARASGLAYPTVRPGANCLPRLGSIC